MKHPAKKVLFLTLRMARGTVTMMDLVVIALYDAT
jgi:hypothetical protein